MMHDVSDKYSKPITALRNRIFRLNVEIGYLKEALETLIKYAGEKKQ